MIDTVLNWFALYGAQALFFALFAGQTGIVPVPTTIVLLTVGALLLDTAISATSVFAWCVSGAVVGDQFGYALGRAGGPRFAAKLQGSRWAPMFERAETYSAKWGALGVFFSRWLVSPIGPYLNYLVGMTKLNWFKFSTMSLAGEAIWISGCLTLGYMFSASITSIDGLLANITWAVGALIATLFIWSRIKKFVANQGNEQESTDPDKGSI